MEIKNFNITEDNLRFLVSKIGGLDLSLGYVCSITIKNHNRTLDQNARLWKLYGEIGNFIGETPDKIHELMGWKFLRGQTVVNNETIVSIKTTTRLTTAEMAEYQNAIERWAATELGFVFEQNY